MVGYACRAAHRRHVTLNVMQHALPANAASCRIVAIVPHASLAPVQPLRLLLMIVLLAFLPLQAWAGIGTFAAGIDMVQTAHVATVGNVAIAADQADLGALSDASDSQDSSMPTDNADPTPPGADFAEQLLPAPLPRGVTSAARSAVPRYAAAVPSDPDLPLLPRPPRV